MAGDWIKMRSSLRRHPKIVRIASALNADRLRVVGGLHAVWCLFDEHSDDGQLCGYTPKAIDDEVSWTGFCDQLIAVGWVAFDGLNVLSLPEFDTHNGVSAKRRAQESDRKRADRAAEKSAAQPVLELSATDADKKRTREEKRREKNTDAQAAFVLPDWIPQETWSAYLETRKGKKAKPTPYALNLVVTELEKIRANGYNPLEALNKSIKSGWTDVYQPKGEPGRVADQFAGAI